MTSPRDTRSGPVNPNSTSRFLTIEQVAAELNITASQTLKLLRRGSLPGVKVGGRGQWRVERTQLEAWIEESRNRTRTYVAEHPTASGSWRSEDNRRDELDELAQN